MLSLVVGRARGELMSLVIGVEVISLVVGEAGGEVMSLVIGVDVMVIYCTKQRWQ